MNNNEIILEQLYTTKTLSSKQLVQYALKMGISCQKLNNFIVSEQYKNNLLMTNIYSKIVKYGLFSNYDMEQFYNIISSVDELEFLLSSIDYEHPNLKKDPMNFILSLKNIKKESLDDFKLYESNMVEKINIYDNEIISTIIELAHKTGISTKKLVNMLNKNYEEVYSSISKLIHSRINKERYKQDILLLLQDIEYLSYKISALNYNYPNYCANNFQQINAILNCSIGDLVKEDNKNLEDEKLNNFVLIKSKNQE